MKRSQVIAMIVSEMNRCVNSHYTTEAHAKTLLTLLEQIGMRPPDYTKWPKKTGAGGAVAATRISGEWEEDNDT